MDPIEIIRSIYELLHDVDMSPLGGDIYDRMPWEEMEQAIYGE